MNPLLLVNGECDWVFILVFGEGMGGEVREGKVNLYILMLLRLCVQYRTVLNCIVLYWSSEESYC